MIDYKTGRDMAANVGDAVMKNSIPLALIGAGIGWFVISSMQGGGGSSSQPRSANQNARGGGQGQNNAQGGGQSGQGGAGRAQGSSGARSTAGKTWSAVRSSTSDWTDAASRRADSAYRTFGDMVQEQPLLLGAAGLIIGAAMGATLPRTRYEDETIGQTRDDLARSVQEFGREQLNRAQQVVERTVDTVREEAERQGLTLESARQALDDVKNRATGLAQTAAETARKEAGLAGEGTGGGNQSDGGQQGGGAQAGGQQAGGSQGGRTGAGGGAVEANRGNDMTSGPAGAGARPAAAGSTEANRGNDMTSQPGAAKPPGAGGTGGTKPPGAGGVGGAGSA